MRGLLHRKIEPAKPGRPLGRSTQPNANATRLEQSKTRPPAVNARKLSDTTSWLRMVHLPFFYAAMLNRID